MKHNKLQILPVVLALWLLISAVPITVFAEQQNNEDNSQYVELHSLPNQLRYDSGNVENSYASDTISDNYISQILAFYDPDETGHFNITTSYS